MSAEANVLFDAPGPRARARHRIVAVVGVVVLLAVLGLLVRALADPANNQLSADKWAPFLLPSSWTSYLIPGLMNTLVAAVISVVLAIALGIVLGLGRLADVAVIRIVSGIIVEFFRAVPVLMMMLFAYYFGLYVLRITGTALPLFGVVVGLTLYNACVIAELVRSGVNSLPRGQGEAGMALGLTPTQTLLAIQLPQAITAMLPSILSQLVVILKDSALGVIITYTDLLRAGSNLGTAYANTIPALIVVAAIYIVVNYLLTKIASLVERRLRTGKRGVRTDIGAPVGVTTAVTADAAAGTEDATVR